MIGKINNNKYIKQATLVNIKFSKDKTFYIWTFKIDEQKKHIGFTPAVIYYGGRTHLWYSLLTGYFLPPSYNINFDTVINKECYIMVDSKAVVRAIVPIVKKVDKEELKEGYKEMKEETSQVAEETFDAQKEAVDPSETKEDDEKDIFQ